MIDATRAESATNDELIEAGALILKTLHERHGDDDTDPGRAITRACDGFDEFATTTGHDTATTERG